MTEQKTEAWLYSFDVRLPFWQGAKQSRKGVEGVDLEANVADMCDELTAKRVTMRFTEREFNTFRKFLHKQGVRLLGIKRVPWHQPEVVL